MYDRKKKYLYIKVTQDEYELPLIVADSSEELARLDNTTKNSVRSSISHDKGKYYRVEFIEDEEDD